MSQTKLSFLAGVKTQHPHYAYTTPAYYQFQWIAVVEGVLHCETASGATPLSRGQAAVLKVGSRFRLSTGSQGYRGVFFVDPAPEDAVFHGAAIPCDIPEAWHKTVAIMMAEANRPQQGSIPMLLGLGRALAWALTRDDAEGHPRNTDADYGRQCAERAREALRMALHSPLGTRDILAGTGLSYRQTSRYFIQAYGVSPKRWLMDLKIKEAQARLKETDIPITALAYELGFSSSQHFAACFTAHVGVSPSGYRQGLASFAESFQGFSVQCSG